jgi:hypothetical protein
MATARSPVNRLSAGEWKSLWGILWRTLLFGPILFPIGACLLALVLGFLVAPPIYAGALIFQGHWIFAVALGATWFVLLLWARPRLRRVFDGFEWASFGFLATLLT